MKCINCQTDNNLRDRKSRGGRCVRCGHPFVFEPTAMTKNFLMVQAPGFIRGINPKSKIENPQAPAFIRGVNLKSKI